MEQFLRRWIFQFRHWLRLFIALIVAVVVLTSEGRKVCKIMFVVALFVRWRCQSSDTKTKFKKQPEKWRDTIESVHFVRRDKFILV